MVKWRKILGLVLLFGGALMTGQGLKVRAATTATSDILSSDRAGEASDTVDIGSLKPLPRPNRIGSKSLPSGNPLWSVPLSVLTATQERPIFSASRRPPQRAVVAPPLDQVGPAAPQKAAEPERPPLALIGAVLGDSDAIAVFLDRTNQKIVRLRQGESYAGWELSSVLRREVMLTKADRVEVIALKGPDASPGPTGTTGVPSLTVPAAASASPMHRSYPAARQRTGNQTDSEPSSIDAR